MVQARLCLCCITPLPNNNNMSVFTASACPQSDLFPATTEQTSLSPNCAFAFAEAENLTSAGDELDDKIDEIARRVSEAEDVHRELNEIQKAKRRHDIRISMAKARLEKLTRQERQKSDERIEKEAELEKIRKEETMLSDLRVAKEAELAGLRSNESVKQLASRRQELYSKVQQGLFIHQVRFFW